jgi:L-amino acid N-acyltransferase YncA
LQPEVGHILSKYLALEKNANKCEDKEKKAPVFSVVYLLNRSQLLGEAALGQHRQQEVYQAPHNITIIIRELEGGDTQKALIKKGVGAITKSLFCGMVCIKPIIFLLKT